MSRFKQFRIALFVLTVTICCFSFILHAQTVAQVDTQAQADLQAKINERAKLITELEKEIKVYDDLANKSSKEALTLQSYIKTLEKQTSSLGLDIKKSQTMIDKKNLEIQKISGAIQGSVERLQRLKAGLIESLYSQYQADNTNLIENFLGNKNLLESAQDIEHLQILQENIDAYTRNVSAEKKVLETDKTEEQLHKQQLEEAREKLKEKQESLALTRAEQKKELDMTKNQESNFKKILEDKKKKKAAFEKEMFDYEAKLKYVLDPASIPKANTGALVWPVDSVYITQKFGRTNASGRLYVSGTHNGVDFRAPVGTVIRSAGQGRVAGTGNTDADCPGVSFGKWILIKYDNGLATTYGHLSKIEVIPGQTVASGQLVGYSGNTGYSTGPHLHVSMYASDAVNPMTRPSASCPGVSMTMPVSAVNAYLDPLVYFPK